VRARVFKSTGLSYTVRTEGGKFLQARLRGKLKLKGSKTTNPVAVGDWVTLDVESGNEVVIRDIEERRNYLIRKSPHKTAYAHIIASNLDQAIVIATLSFPRTSLGFIDRFLVAAESFGIPAKMLFNKRDLLSEEEIQRTEELIQMYENVGYPAFSISAKIEDGVKLVSQLSENKTTLFSGHSGVGKSTLLNAFDIGKQLKTAEVSKFANKGVHTTTFAEMFETKAGTFIIDTPGIKELGLIDMEPWEVSHYFPEMLKVLDNCQFNNCLHVNEKNCAVMSAVSSGEIALSRYENYLSILEDEDNRR